MSSIKDVFEEQIVPSAIVPRRSRGRPSLSEAADLRETLLDEAAALFVEHGYGAASIGMIAEQANITKKTFYKHFPDKRAVFEAVSHRDLVRFTAGLPDDTTQLDLRGALYAIAAPLLALWQTPVAGTVRMIYAEGLRFPNLAAILYETTVATERCVATILTRYADSHTDIDRAAGGFIRMIYMGPQTWMLFHPLEIYPDEQQRLDVHSVVEMFASGWLNAFPL